MMKFRSNGLNATETYGNIYVTFQGAPPKVLELDRDKEYEVSFKPYRKSRSLSANAYCWLLCERIAKELSKEAYTSNEDIYRDAILKAGVYRIMKIAYGDLPNVINDWGSNGVGWQVVPHMPYEYNQDTEIECRFYVGSSRYNTEEMARLIEHLIDECENLGISTEDEQYIASLLDHWNE